MEVLVITLLSLIPSQYLLIKRKITSLACLIVKDDSSRISGYLLNNFKQKTLIDHLHHLSIPGVVYQVSF